MTGIAVSPTTPAAPVAPAAADNAAPQTPAAVGNDPAAPSAPAADPGITVGSPSAPATPGANDPWHASLKDAGVKDWAAKKNWADNEAALKSHMELEQAFSGKLAALKPKTAAEYSFQMPTNLPEGMSVDDTFMGSFKNWAFDADISNDQASKIVNGYVKFASEAMTAHAQKAAQEQGEKIVNSEKALKQEWGAPETPTFQRNMELARRTMTQAGISNDDLVQAGVLAKVGDKTVVTNAKMMSFFAKVGNQMYAEDTIYGKTNTNNENPFDPKSLNLKAQGDLFSKDPQRAAMLIDSLPQNERAQHNALRAALRAKGF